VALRELGRIERTLFIRDWMQSVGLRRRVHTGLNKGEARNALTRAVFFHLSSRKSGAPKSREQSHYAGSLRSGGNAEQAAGAK
jgi:TnpA family transposase